MKQTYNTNHCIQCKHIQRTGFNNKGLFEHKCLITNKSIKMMDFACQSFEEQEKTDDLEIVEITVKPSIIKTILKLFS